jgi:hypothetical protein
MAAYTPPSPSYPHPQRPGPSSPGSTTADPTLAARAQSFALLTTSGSSLDAALAFHSLSLSATRPDAHRQSSAPAGYAPAAREFSDPTARPAAPHAWARRRWCPVILAISARNADMSLGPRALIPASPGYYLSSPHSSVGSPCSAASPTQLDRPDPGTAMVPSFPHHHSTGVSRSPFVYVPLLSAPLAGSNRDRP